MNAEEIKQKAVELSNQGKRWHFHILTPKCQLNQSGEYVLMLENDSDDESFVCYSKKPMMKTGEELVKMLHGEDVMKSEKLDNNPSSGMKEILKKATELNENGKYWHHHMLFPDCIFNQDKGKWSIIFEDASSGEVLKVLSDTEPKNDLKLIENLYYKQKTLD